MKDGHAERTLAYEIATRATTLMGSEYPGFVHAAELILARLGNFPGRDLLKHRFGATSNQSALLRLEMRMREIENTSTDAGGTNRTLTDFQCDSMNAFVSHSSVSLSAPTSAGKSFLLLLEVMRSLRENTPAGIVYVVPTRSLIRQVVVDLRTFLIKSSLPFPIIRSMPKAVAKNEAPDGVIYVLTQERLLSLLNAEEAPLWLSALIVDEAQEIGSGSRGILLHTAIESLLFQFPHVRVIFASPLARNPEYLTDLFSCKDAISQSELHSPVSQNIILVESSHSSVREISCKLVVDEEIVDLGTRELKYRFSGVSSTRRLAIFARSLISTESRDESCIIYANGAVAAERISRHLTRLLPLLQPLDPSIEEFVDYLKDYVHFEYGLIDVLKYGVAFHYGNMPSSVRAGIEDLFKQRKLRFICCTSTLLQGVNLPARHIVIEAPKRGNKSPMERADFLNLAGRAGRLKQEFHGNVWCLRPSHWIKSCFEGERQTEIKSAFEKMIHDGGVAIRKVMEDDDPKAENLGAAVAAMGRIFTEFVQKGRDLIPTKDGDPASLNLTLEMLRVLRSDVSLPASIFARNTGVHPQRLENLYQHLFNQKDLSEFIPIAPRRPGVHARLKLIFQLVQRHLMGIEDNSFSQHAKIAQGWIHDEPLSSIISKEVSYRRSEASKNEVKFNPSRVIYGVVYTIESVIRFRYVRNLRAYHDVLGQALRIRGAPEADSLVPMHLFLECGASKLVTLNLISLGISRMTALLLEKRITLSGSSTPEQCLKLCRDAIFNAPNMKIPAIARREVDSFTGGS